jgi:hypothetical protein
MPAKGRDFTIRFASVAPDRPPVPGGWNVPFVFGKERAMDTSILLARIIGPMFFIIGAGILINPEVYRRMIADFANSPLLIYIAGSIAILLGLIVVTFHNVWVWHWPALVTLIGWLTLVVGAVRILAPRLVADRASRYARNINTVMATAIVLLVIGGVLAYFGYAPSA